MLTPPDFTPFCAAGIEGALFGHHLPPGTPLVFAIHGRNSCMQRKYGFCRELAAAGLMSIAINQRNHGSRCVDPSLQAPDRLESALDLMAIIAGTACDISLLIDCLEPLLGLTPARLGVSGTSMGGSVVAEAMMMDTRIHAGASIVGTGSFQELCLYHMRRTNIPQNEIDALFTPAREKFFQRFDPVHHAAAFRDRPLLLTSGGKDTDVPPDCIRHFHRALEKEYTHPALLKLEHFPEFGHDAPPPMRRAAVDWLVRHLT